MYAIFVCKNKQYKANIGKTIKTEKIEKKTGEKIEFNQILMINTNNCVHIGKPYLKNCIVKGVIISQKKNKKIKIIKFKRRKHYKKQQGHRQKFTEVKITEIIKN
ncbi:50S ribosomal protein L21 [Buchnera aphidicola (Tetraneura ulmi)]